MRPTIYLLLCAAAYAQGFDAARMQRLDRMVRDSVAAREFGGIEAVLAHKGKVVWSKAEGVPAGSIYRMASMSKPIASAAAMILYEEGKFLLDDPVSKWIPGMDKVRVLADENGVATVELETPMTVHHLLTHTSGLSNAKAYGAAKTFDRAGTLRDMAAKLPLVPLAHQPGAAWRYGQSIDVLGHLIEIWSGQPFDAFLRERMFEPLGMKDTGFSVPAENAGRVAPLFTLNAAGQVEPAKQQGNPTRKPTFLSGGGGLYSTASDYLRFCQMLLNGGSLDGRRVLSRATVDFMLRDHVPLPVMRPNGPNNRRGHGFGIGGAVLLDAAKSEVLAADGDFNWGGANGTYFWIDRKNQLIGLWMVQRPPFTPGPGKRFRVLAYQALE